GAIRRAYAHWTQEVQRALSARRLYLSGRPATAGPGPWRHYRPNGRAGLRCVRSRAGTGPGAIRNGGSSIRAGLLAVSRGVAKPARSSGTAIRPRSAVQLEQPRRQRSSAAVNGGNASRARAAAASPSGGLAARTRVPAAAAYAGAGDTETRPARAA